MKYGWVSPARNRSSLGNDDFSRWMMARVRDALWRPRQDGNNRDGLAISKSKSSHNQVSEIDCLYAR
jgi:hypothetical protein